MITEEDREATKDMSLSEIRLYFERKNGIKTKLISHEEVEQGVEEALTHLRKERK